MRLKVPLGVGLKSALTVRVLTASPVSCFRRMIMLVEYPVATYSPVGSNATPVHVPFTPCNECEGGQKLSGINDSLGRFRF